MSPYKIWKANEIAWLKHQEGTYTVRQVMEKFECNRNSVFYILNKHRLDFILEVTGFKKGNKLTYRKKSLREKYAHIITTS
jgi:hypothetical protein